MSDFEKSTSVAEKKSPALDVGDSTAASSPEHSVAHHDSGAEARVVRKLDRHLMPLVFALYMLAYLDRSNIGNARIAGMAKDLHLSSYDYNWLVTIFYITYVLAEPTQLLWKIWPPHIVATIVIFSWGLVASLQAATSNWGGMMALRFLLGGFEAAFGPAIVYYLSFFYLRYEVGFRVGILVSAAPLASTWAGALAYGITSGHSHLANWRLLFLVEGLPTVVMAFVAFFFLPDSPDKMRVLNEEDKAAVRSRVYRQVGTSAQERIGSFNPKEIALVLLDLKAWICAFMYFCGNVTFSSLSVFLPTILEDMGYTAINAQGLSAPPSFAAFLFALITTWIADKTRQRCIVIFVTCVIGGAGYIILVTVEKVGVRYFATFLVSAGVFSTIPNIVALQLNNQGSDARRGTGLVLLQAIGQCGAFLGAQLFPLSEAPRYIKGNSTCAAFMFFSALLVAAQRFLLSWENSKLDRKFASQPKATPDTNSEEEAIENYGPNFRFCL